MELTSTIMEAPCGESRRRAKTEEEEGSWWNGVEALRWELCSGGRRTPTGDSGELRVWLSSVPLGIKSISSSFFCFLFFLKDSASRQRCSSHDSTWDFCFSSEFLSDLIAKRFIKQTVFIEKMAWNKIKLAWDYSVYCTLIQMLCYAEKAKKKDTRRVKTDSLSNDKWQSFNRIFLSVVALSVTAIFAFVQSPGKQIPSTNVSTQKHM